MKTKVSDTSDSVPPTAQPEKRRRRTPAPAFRVAQGSKLVTRNSRATTLTKNANGRRGHQTQARRPLVRKEPPEEPVPDPPPISDSPLLDVGQLDDFASLSETPVPSQQPQPSQPKKRQNTVLVSTPHYHILAITDNNKTKLDDWLIYRQACVDELLRHDGLGDFLDNKFCVSCNKVAGMYKCKDCFSGCSLRCRDCLVHSHQDHPLHRIEARFQNFKFDLLNLTEYCRSGTAAFFLWLLFKVSVSVSSSVTAVHRVLFRPLVLQTFAFSTPQEFTLFLSISVTA